MHEQKPSKRLFLSQAASCTYRSYLRLSPPLLTVLNCQFLLRNCFFTAKGFRSNISEKLRSFEVYLQIIVLLKNMSRKKSLFFAFFAKICKKMLFFAFSAAILYILFSSKRSVRPVYDLLKNNIIQ